MNGKKKLMLALSTVVCAAALVSGGALTYGGASAAEPVHSCNHSEYCLVCDVADKINALPDAADITIENAAAVTQQIHDIDRIKYDLSDEEYDEVETLVETISYGRPYKYEMAIETIKGLDVGVSDFVVVKKMALGGETLSDTSETEVSFEIVGLDTDYTATLTMFDLGVSVSQLGADYYEQTADGWSFKYKLPAGRYEITELTSSTATIINGKRWQNTTVSVEANGQTIEGNTTTVTLTAGETTSISYLNTYAPVTAYVFTDEWGTPVSGNVTFTDTNLGYTETAYGGVYETYEVPTSLSGTLTVLSVPDGYCLPDAIDYTISYGDMLTFGALEVFQQREGAEATFTLRLTEHNYAWQEGTPVGCENDGIAAHYHCENCDKYFDASHEEVDYQTLITPQSGHAYGGWSPISDTEEGRECANCHDVQTRPLANDGGEDGAEQQPAALAVPIAVVIIGGIFVVAVMMFLATKKE